MKYEFKLSDYHKYTEVSVYMPLFKWKIDFAIIHEMCHIWGKNYERKYYLLNFEYLNYRNTKIFGWKEWAGFGR